MTTYQQVAMRIINLIENGVLKNGDKIPSLRQLSQELNVSVGTVREAYWRLENDRYISAIPQSGYYVQDQPAASSASNEIKPAEMDPKEVSLCRIYGSLQEKHQVTPEISLGVATLDPEDYPVEKLSRYIQASLKRRPYASMDYMMPPGYLPLRQQISRHSLSSGKEYTPDEIIITNGCHEAAFLALMALCRPGDTIAIESPVYFNFLSLLDALGLKVVEIPIQGGKGMNLDVLKFVLENQNVKALFSITNFNNPTGTSLSDNHKQELLALLAEYGIPLIEDDIYGDLSFGQRPRTCKSFDAEDNVILCSSFSKSLSPGLRIGWIAPGKYYDQIAGFKTLLNVGTSSLAQIALASYLKEGGYERHLRKVRKTLYDNMTDARKTVLSSFPEGTAVTKPEGGFVLWATLPEPVDTGEIYYQALQEGILIAPGCLFTQKEKYNTSMRLNFGMWNERSINAVKRLGEIAKSYR